MLTLVEEILLLSLDAKTGRTAKVPSYSVEFAVAGAALTELALQDRIDRWPCVLSRCREAIIWSPAGRLASFGGLFFHSTCCGLCFLPVPVFVDTSMKRS